MASGATPHFKNDEGHQKIAIGAREFMCVGATPPFDHPHVFLDMGSDTQKVCPYCSTLYFYDSALKSGQTEPSGCAFDASQNAA